LSSIFSNIIKQSAEFEQTQKQLQAVLNSTGNAAGFTREELNKLGIELANKSTFDTSEITAAQTALLAFSGIVGDDFVRAQQAAADMAARTGMSLTSAAETIGRALDVPSQGMAALSRQGFRFSEQQKELVKYLEDTGRTSEAQALILQELEASYNGAALAARDTFSGALGAVKNSLNDLMQGGGGSLNGAKEGLNALNATLGQDEIKHTWAAIVTYVTQGLASILNASDKIINALDILKRSIASVTSAAQGFAGVATTIVSGAGVIGGAITDFVGLTDNATKKVLDFQSKAANFSKAAFKDTADIWRAPLAGSKIYQEAKNQAKNLNDEKAKSIKLNEKELLSQLEAKKAADLAAKANAKNITKLKTQKQAIDEVFKAYQKQQEAINAELQSLERTITLWGKTNEQVKIYDLTLKGANAAQLEQAKNQLAIIDNLEQQKAANEAYYSLVKDLQTEEEKRTTELKSQLAILDKQAALNGKVDKNAYKKVIDGAFTPPPITSKPKEQEADTLDKLKTEQEQLNAWHKEQLDLLKEYRANRVDLNQEWDQKEQELQTQHAQAMVAIEAARQEAILTKANEFLGGLSALQNSKNKEAQQIGKGAAVIETTIATYSAAMKAYSAMASIPIVGPALGLSAAAAAVSFGMDKVNKIKGMAHDGIDKIPQTGTWLLEKGERVTTAKTSAKLDKTLDNIKFNQTNKRIIGRMCETTDLIGLQVSIDA